MGGALPKSPEGILKEVIAPTLTAPILAVKSLYKATDPLGLDAAKASSKEQLEAMQRSQQNAADAQAELLKKQGPRPNPSEAALNPARRLERLRAGLASTIKTSGAGTTPALATPSLVGAKTKLGA